MTMSDLRPLLAEHPYFRDLSPEYLDLIVGCARNILFKKDEYLFREGDEANDFYLVRHGRVAIEMDFGYAQRLVHTVNAGESLGWSWLVPPHCWRFHARASELTRAVALDGACLRRKCEQDKGLGYELLLRFASDMEEHLYRAWIQVADIYGTPHA